MAKNITEIQNTKFLDNQKKFSNITNLVDTLEANKDVLSKYLINTEFEFEADNFDFKMLDGVIAFKVDSYNLLTNLIDQLNEISSRLIQENNRLIK